MARHENGVELIKRCCPRLLTYGVKEVVFEYDGSGDSGDFFDAHAVVSPTVSQIDDEVAAHITAPANGSGKQKSIHDKNVSWADFTEERRKEKDPLITSQMCDDIADNVFELLPGGWEINDGSYGVITIDTASGNIKIDHNERYTDVRSETFNY